MGPLSPKSVLLRGKLAEGILLTYEKGVVYWSISSLTRLGPFLGQEPGFIHFGDLRVMLDLVWVAETACPAPLPLTLWQMESNLHHGWVGKMVLMGKVAPHGAHARC